ncbi:hypothetical protein AWW66_03375 [Micromonospora rosaria]|uniref:Uncharacterized protein n=1 Tax=Micromonospora rosaria TaxID=47874 RepID=A0A136PYD1_9ACTN|nr:GIY-YIG nuclease family protein [Micromonospora rosaria]KXK63367.1 hypothetical protein AWW66_03375 [Micromonospora rosaria]
MEQLHGVEFVTTNEACAQLGPDITPYVINNWVRRGLLTPAGRLPGRSHLFKWDDIVEVERRTRTSPKGRKRKVTLTAHLPKITSDATMTELPSETDAAQKRTGSIVPPPDRPVVYYIAFADRVKIGHSRALRTRLDNLPHDEVLAVEPGQRDLEQMRHRQFADQRITGEWFRHDAALRSHIEMLIDHFGPPEHVLGWRP